MGKSVVHLGPTGAGALLKLINNFLCGVQAAALAEALALIEKAGLDRETATHVLANGAPGSPLVRGILPRMLAADYTPAFPSLAHAEGPRVFLEGGRTVGCWTLDGPAGARRVPSSGVGGSRPAGFLSRDRAASRMTMTRLSVPIAVLCLWSTPSAGQAPFPVTIRVDASQPKGELKPIWRFFGADEPNYAT